MNILFICNQNQNRSKRAEELFSNRFTTRSSGLFNEQPVQSNDLEWADLIFVMEEHQRSSLGHKFPALYLQKQILNLDIPDIYSYGDPKLDDLLKEKFTLSMHQIGALHPSTS